ncbi:MAG: hypothetical protein R3A52_10325 [Polyangiales bacterium]
MLGAVPRDVAVSVVVDDLHEAREGAGLVQVASHGAVEALDGAQVEVGGRVET